MAAALMVGDGLLQVHIVKARSKSEADKFYEAFGCPKHHFVDGESKPD